MAPFAESRYIWITEEKRPSDTVTTDISGRSLMNIVWYQTSGRIRRMLRFGGVFWADVFSASAPLGSNIGDRALGSCSAMPGTRIRSARSRLGRGYEEEFCHSRSDRAELYPSFRRRLTVSNFSLRTKIFPSHFKLNHPDQRYRCS